MLWLAQNCIFFSLTVQFCFGQLKKNYIFVFIFKITVVLEQVGAVFLIAMPLLDLQCHRTL